MHTPPIPPLGVSWPKLHFTGTQISTAKTEKEKEENSRRDQGLAYPSKLAGDSVLYAWNTRKQVRKEEELTRETNALLVLSGGVLTHPCLR